MGRSLRTPRNPDLFGRVVAALRVMSGQRAPMNALEQSLQAELAGRQIHSRVAQQLIATFDATPRAARRRLLGDIGFPTFVGASEVVTPDVPSLTTTVPVGPLVDGPRSHGLAVDPDVPTDVQYTVRYQGFFCEEESSWDGGSGSDEMYFVTSAVLASTNEVHTVRHPLGHETHYGDVDTDEVRIGPVAVVWKGDADVVSLVVTAFEHDHGDPDAYRDEVDVLVKATIVVLTKLYTPAALLALFHESITDLVNWLLGTGDDLVSVETVVLPRAVLELYAGQVHGLYVAQVRRPSIRNGQIVWGYQPLVTNLPYHFTTVHKGGGGHYVACFDVQRHPPLPGPIIL